MIVLFWSRATRDLLKSFGWGIAALQSVTCSDEVAIPRRRPHSVSRSPVKKNPLVETVLSDFQALPFREIPRRVVFAPAKPSTARPPTIFLSVWGFMLVAAVAT